MMNRLKLRLKKNLSKTYRQSIRFESDYRYRVIDLGDHFRIEKRMSGYWIFAHWMRLPVIFNTYDRAKNKIIILGIHHTFKLG